MNAGELEELVAAFLDVRGERPDFSPEDFASAHGSDAPEVASAIRRALGIERLFADAALSAPERIGAYRVVREIGRGGMGVVYEVEKEGERLALKLMHVGSGSGGSALERFTREARSLARLAHPHVVAVRDTGVERGDPYLVMELVAGVPLSQVHGLDERRAAEITRDLARAVHAAHECGVLHRDLKPHNVIVRSDGTPVLIDFGLVAVADEATLTSTGAVLGTPRYMAPEQARGRPADRRTDVFGLGLVLHELLCGRPARAEASRDVMIDRVARQDVSWPRRSGQGPGQRIDPALARIAMAALARNPARRTPTAAELADDLQRWLDGANVHAHPPSRLAQALDRARERPAWQTIGVVGAALLLAFLALRIAHSVPSEARAREALDRSMAEVSRLLHQGRVGAGVQLAIDDVASFAGTGVDAGAELPKLLSAAPAAEVRTVLGQFIETHPREIMAHYLLAWSLDSAHELEAAAQGYRTVFEMEPGDSNGTGELARIEADTRLRARLNLAHLHAGAQLGACAACDAAYATAPDMLAPSESLALLLEALAADCGSSDFAAGRIVQTTLDLARRAPEVGAPRKVIAALDPLLEGTALASGARSRLEDAKRRLSAAAGG